ncbi:MAG: hypothetical protein QMD61_05245 [Methanobacterium sp.]|nr:hypothetical protein [Methanobacterium sp.]
MMLNIILLNNINKWPLMDYSYLITIALIFFLIIKSLSNDDTPNKYTNLLNKVSGVAIYPLLLLFIIMIASKALDVA